MKEVRSSPVSCSCWSQNERGFRAEFTSSNYRVCFCVSFASRHTTSSLVSCGLPWGRAGPARATSDVLQSPLLLKTFQYRSTILIIKNFFTSLCTSPLAGKKSHFRKDLKTIINFQYICQSRTERFLINVINQHRHRQS